ncbi:gamma-glutamyl-gamma-aminobutyrate hydrolase family protein [Parendozoicomonas haliclonae]|uniref:gamma-glutamyl-gamma-aminobutyrate hydrolase n=1 Tax=Parendozoicomonas haliclonae TaxID=1960125 RepID=A0A1X7ATR7_9GAMM|nr:gamma-glutamyl-gamma-aminobutyrate hydrolase family protein [Parendozoicomonas haliclonae]SMA50807.1 Gamma-glutamyl-gamma-aminobutyrate hydrolase PuuD [Parendozoicomonas haliclonae]
MSESGNKPVIGVISCEKTVKIYQVQSVNHFYLQAIRDYGGLPLLIPAGCDEADREQLLAMVDGVFLPGSPSNVAPRHYGATHEEPATDEGRDDLSLPIIRQCLGKGIPIFGICRGFQEMNVALGGQLHPKVHELSGYLDHREPEESEYEIKYAFAHGLTLQEGGLFRQWFPDQTEFQVNSLHGQGVKSVAPRLVVEAVAPDGLVEAFSLPEHPFFVGVQWHPEWKATELPLSKALFSRFIASAQAKRAG